MCPVRTVTHVSGRSFVSGMADRLADLVDPKNDPVGLQFEEETLPKRIRGDSFLSKIVCDICRRQQTRRFRRE